MKPAVLCVVVFISLGASAWGGALETYYQTGMRLYERGELDQASRYFLAILRSDPRNAASYQALGNIRFQQGERDQALEAYERSLALDPSQTKLRAFVDWLESEQEKKGGASKAVQASGQKTLIPREKFTFKMGLTYSSVTGAGQFQASDGHPFPTSAEESFPDGSAGGPVAGFGYLIRPWGWMGFQPGIMYVHKGVRSDRGTWAEAVDFDYLEIPLHLKFFFLKTKRSNFFLGPYLAFALSRSRSLEGNPPEAVRELHYDLAKYDVGYQVGVEISFSRCFLLEWTMFDDGLVPVLQGTTIRNTAGRVMGGYRF